MGLADRNVFDRKAEESGKADGLDAGIDRFEGAAVDLRAHVDAKGGLQVGARGQGIVGVVAGACGKQAQKPALVGDLVGLMQDQIDGERRIVAQAFVRRQLGGGLHLGLPGPAERLVAALEEQRETP